MESSNQTSEPAQQRPNTPRSATGVQQSTSKTSVMSTGKFLYRSFFYYTIGFRLGSVEILFGKSTH